MGSSRVKKIAEQAKTLIFSMQVRTEFTIHLMGQDGVWLFDYEGYILPAFLPERGFSGEYLTLDIDIDSGQITNWQKPTREQIGTFIAQKYGNDDD